MATYPRPNFTQSHPIYATSVSLDYETEAVTLVRSGLVVGWDSTEPDGSEMLPHVLFTLHHGADGLSSRHVGSPFTVRALCSGDARWFFAPSQEAALSQARQYCRAVADPFADVSPQ